MELAAYTRTNTKVSAMVNTNSGSNSSQLTSGSYATVIGTFALVLAFSSICLILVLYGGLQDSVDRYASFAVAKDLSDLASEAHDHRLDAIAFAGAVGRLDIVSAVLALISIVALFLALPFTLFIRVMTEMEARKVTREELPLIVGTWLKEDADELVKSVVESAAEHAFQEYKNELVARLVERWSDISTTAQFNETIEARSTMNSPSQGVFDTLNNLSVSEGGS